jgi:4-alpha-glucanotransferase
MGHFYPALPIREDEFRGRGINFDYDRFTKPFIRDYFLHEVFGEFTDYAKQTYLEDRGNGVYTLKPFVDTQRKAADLLAPTEEMGMDERARNEKLKRGLWALHAEVLMLDPNSNGEFHPRHSLEKTHSYRELDGHSQHQLRELYIDYFYRRQEDFWREKAMVKLPAIRNATNMLICAEDLGMVPACVPGVMEELSMLRLAIQRMPPDPDRDFWHPADTPYLCVASPSCHDMSTIRGWWEEDREVTDKFWHTILGHNEPMPYFCEPHVVKEIVAQHLWAPCMLAVFPIQDFLGMDPKLRREDPRSEQINVPANPEHYWRYRMHIALEDLLKEDAFNNELRELVAATGRLTAY